MGNSLIKSKPFLEMSVKLNFTFVCITNGQISLIHCYCSFNIVDYRLFKILLLGYIVLSRRHLDKLLELLGLTHCSLLCVLPEEDSAILEP